VELYRHYVVFALKRLKFLDATAVSAAERAAATNRFSAATSRPPLRPIKEVMKGILPKGTLLQGLLGRKGKRIATASSSAASPATASPSVGAEK
jgi:hypothetical protein